MVAPALGSSSIGAFVLCAWNPSPPGPRTTSQEHSGARKGGSLKLTASIGFAALAVAFVFTAIAAARPEANSIQLRTVLNSRDEVPAPSGDVANARGTFTATVDASGSISWQLTFSGLTGNANAAHIHTGAPGSPGPVVVPLCGPCQSPVSGTGNVTEAVVAAIESGNAYVNVHTTANAPGEIRGQLGVSAAVTTQLNSRQERPKPTGNVRRASGTFTATVSKSGATGRITWRLRYSRLTGRATAAHIHIAQRGRPGPVAVPLCGPCRNGVRGTANLTPAVLTALEAGRAYVNIHTARNPAGEIRGQIRAVPLSLN